MKFKDFVKWCNNRASDGCWDFISATCCINIIEKVRKEKWWRREKYWKENYEHDVLKDIIIPINEKKRNTVKEVIKMRRMLCYIGLFILIFALGYSINTNNEGLQLSSILSIIVFVAIIIFDHKFI